jgi:hypothetical protein
MDERTPKQPPLVLHWNDAYHPLPRRQIQAPVRRSPSYLGLEAPPYWQTGQPGQPFDFCGHIQRLCADIVVRCGSLSHVDAGRLLIGVTQARSGRRRGLQARVTPLRCRGGTLNRPWRGATYQVQRYFVNDREMLYLVTFCLPRFLDQDFDEKFITLFHELYHISPSFNGDFRRHAGRCLLHNRSKRRYDEEMAHLARAYRATNPDPGLYDFLRLNFAQLEHRHGSVIGVMVPRPKLIPVSMPEPAW